MKIEDKQNIPQKEYSYSIYITACLAVLSLMRLVAFRRGAEAAFEAGDFAFKLTLLFAFCSLAWVIGRKYNLRYMVRCGLSGIAFITPGIIQLLGTVFSSKLPVSGLLIMTFSVVIFGGMVLIISYPFQLLFFKLRSNELTDSY